jgi:hypothetical protein
MATPRIKVLVKPLLPPLWGSWGRGFEAHVPTTKCIDKDVVYPCVFPTYIKGVLRRCAYLVLDHMARLGIADSKLFVKVFGPSAIEDKVRVSILDEPSCVSISVGKIVSEAEVRRILSTWPRPEDVNPVPIRSAVFIEPHVRLRDETWTAAEGALFTEEKVLSDLYVYFGIEFTCNLGSDELVKAVEMLLLSLVMTRYEPVARGSPAEVCIHVENVGSEEVESIVKLINSSTTWCRV